MDVRPGPHHDERGLGLAPTRGHPVTPAPRAVNAFLKVPFR